MSQESRTSRIHIKRRVELSSLQNEPSSAHNEPESSETSKKSVDIFSLKEKYNIQNQKLKKEIAELKRSSPGNSGTELKIILSKCPKERKLKSKKIVKTNKEKRVFGNDSEEKDIESDDEKMKKTPGLIIRANNCEICHKLIPELQKSLALKFRSSVTQLTKWLNSIHKFRRATTQMRNSEKLPKDFRRKKLRCIKAAKELFRKNDPNITDYDKKSLLRMLTNRAFHSPEMSDTDEKDHLKTVVNIYDLFWQSAKLKHLLRNVFDPQSASNTNAQLQRKQNYFDEI
ncbi:hypothetical protein Glove_142g33 [Diversispora epigaea]|uniref:Uncharacterized protein n=1 Tax=Diversispora epigaea TaxID=1348612 RepID=A0A397IUS4_9GLOM|nr:hypothetical protein Glove_142g33 [Diversispora epigaea]